MGREGREGKGGGVPGEAVGGCSPRTPLHSMRAVWVLRSLPTENPRWIFYGGAPEVSQE